MGRPRRAANAFHLSEVPAFARLPGVKFRAGIVSFLSLIYLALPAPAGVPANAVFVMSYFKANGGGGDERLYISTSPDGLTWTSIAGDNPVWQPPNWAPFTNVVRDPSIIYEKGWFWVAFTSGNYGNHAAFGLVKSQDLVNWTYLGDISAPVPGATAQLTWNPVFFRDGDGSVHLFLNISPDGGPTYACTPNMRSYVTQPASADWTQWTTPALLSLPSTNTNEFFCWKEGPIYHGVYVDFNNGGGWQHVTSTNLVTGWTAADYMYFNAYEGGMVLKNPSGGYRFFCEQDAGYFFCDVNEELVDGHDTQPVTSDVSMNNGKMISMPGATTFAAWAAANTPSASGPLDNPSGDGTCNLLKCALGLDPNQSEAANLPAAQVVTYGGSQYLRFQYYRHPQYLNLCTTVQSSADSKSWNPIAPLSITLMIDGSELVESRVPLSSRARFLRIEATQQ
jgi:hypothetical protein